MLHSMVRAQIDLNKGYTQDLAQKAFFADLEKREETLSEKIRITRFESILLNIVKDLLEHKSVFIPNDKESLTGIEI